MSKLRYSGKKVALLALVFLLAGCSLGLPAAPAEPTPNLNAVRTEAAQTVIANLTVEAALNPSPTSPPPPTQTPEPLVVSSTPLPQATALPSLTAPAPPAAATQKPTWVVYPTWTRTPYTDAAQLVDQSPRDGFVIGGGGDFDIVWTIKNVGLRPWNTQFYIRYLSGVKGSKGTKYMLSGPVNVNDNATFRVDMIAPYEPGNYVTRWQLINDDGTVIFTPYLSFTVQ